MVKNIVSYFVGRTEVKIVSNRSV